jgi:hypothetical protein
MVSARLLSEQCATCVFRPGNLMHLKAGRLKDLVDGNLAAGALLTCHETTYGQTPAEALCRGFWDRYRERANAYRVMERLTAATGQPWWEEVPPPSGEHP